MIEVIVGDIVAQKTEAIVNSANPTLLAGSGISGAIHKAAGPDLEKECIDIGHCPTGDARITSGYALEARYVIHAVPPKYWDGNRGEVESLRLMYRSILQLIKKYEIKSLSVPVIGAGINRFPLEIAAKIAIEAVWRLDFECEIYFVCFDEKQFELYVANLKI